MNFCLLSVVIISVSQIEWGAPKPRISQFTKILCRYNQTKLNFKLLQQQMSKISSIIMIIFLVRKNKIQGKPQKEILNEGFLLINDFHILYILFNFNLLIAEVGAAKYQNTFLNSINEHSQERPKLWINRNVFIKKLSDKNLHRCLSSSIDSGGTQSKKIEMIQRLNQIVGGISITSIDERKDGEDQIIQKLEKLEEEAKNQDFKDIMKMINLAIGKRVLNIEITKKRTQNWNKMEKKKQIESQFRSNRIKNFPYEELAFQKLKNNIFIAKPYSDGKGFVESTFMYDKLISIKTQQIYSDYFEQCNFLQTILKINKIFLENFSGGSSTDCFQIVKKNSMIRIGFFLFLLALLLSFVFHSFQNWTAEYTSILTVVNCLAVLVLVGLSFWNNALKITNKNQFQQTFQLIRRYLNQLNQENQKKKKRYIWNCHPQLIYIQVKFKTEKVKEAEEEEELVDQDSGSSDKVLYAIKIHQYK